MNSIYLFCLLVVGGAWAESENGCDLNLASVFRTPKDLSRVNFDHFEILERNNFENQDSVVTNDATPAEENPLRSVANAQVMLRFGGDNIHDCNQIALPSCGYPRVEKDWDLGFVRPLPCERPAPLPLPLFTTFNQPCYTPYSQYLPISPILPLPSISPVTSIYSYPAPPPFAFPGCYYRPLSFPTYAASPYSLYNGQLFPGEEITESVVNYGPGETVVEEKIITNAGEEIDVQWTDNQNYPDTEIVETIVPEQTWINTPNVVVEDQAYIVNNTPEMIEETVVDAPNVPLVVSSMPEIITADNLSFDVNPCPKQVSYVEVSLADAPRCEYIETPTTGIDTLLDQALIPFTCQKCSGLGRSLVSYPVFDNEVTILNGPEEIIEAKGCSSCQGWDSCNRFRNPRIPYGTRFSKDVDSLFEVISPDCPLPCIPPTLYQSKFETMPLKKWSPLQLIAPKFFPKLIGSTCGPCSDSYVSSSTPLASTTIISSPNYPTYPSCATEVVEVKSESPCLDTPMIKEVVEIDSPCADSISTISTPSEVISMSPLYSSGYISGLESDYSYGFPQYDIEQPEVVLDGYEMSTGDGYYSDPYQTIVYKQPTFWDVIKTPRYTTPIVERKEYVEPYAYNTLPKYDTISEVDIAPVAEVMPATDYVCNECNDDLPFRYVRGGLSSFVPLGSGPWAPNWPYVRDLAWKDSLPNYM